MITDRIVTLGSEVKDNLSLGKGNLCFFCTEGDQSVYYRIDGIKSCVLLYPHHGMRTAEIWNWR